MSRLRILLLGAAAAAPLAWNWLRLEDPARTPRATLLLLLALVPGVGRSRFQRAALAAGSLLVACGIAFRVTPGPHYPGQTASRLWRGFLEFYDVRLPFPTASHPHMEGAILLAFFAFTAAVVLAVAERRPALAAIVLLVGAGWPATLLDGDELLRGAVILASLLVVLAGTRERPEVPSRAVLVGAAVVLVGVAASSSPALAKRQFLGWETWDLHAPATKPVSVSYVWSSNYSGLTFPRKKTVVLRIKAPSTPEYWRITSLANVVDGRWVDEPVVDQTANGLGEAGLVPDAARKRKNLVEQEVTVEALRDSRLPAGEVPTAFEASGLGHVLYDPAGVAYLTHSLRTGDRYRAWSFDPRPTPRQLARSKPVYPAVISRDGRYLEVDWGAWVPPFGAPDRDAAVRDLFASRYQLAAYRPLYVAALRVAGDARSPYAAAVALESWFRTGGGFSYSQHPPRAVGRPPLVDFVTRTRAGYCQHFAGAMALMLRYLGIPARVAAGFSSGTYAKGEWTVTDHDAHEWVEVWFRGWGWVPFDPTPSRGGVAGAYSASSAAFNATAAALVLAGKQGLKAFSLRRSELGFPEGSSRFSADIRLSVAPGNTRFERRRSTAPELLRLLALVLVGVLVAIAALKLSVRRARYLTRDPRRLASACRRELRDILVDQGVEAPASATVAELAALAGSELGLEPAGVGLHATVARFASPASAREAASELRHSLRRLRRSVRQELTRWERARGLFSLRSLGLS